MSLEPKRSTFVFFSYAHRDKALRDRLEDHLSNLKYRGLITTWHDREIQAGEVWVRQIDTYLEKAHIVLLLISSDFMASQYCYGIEMRRALERYERREADVIPILLRPVLYTDTPFAKLQMLPTNGKPVTLWRDRDSAFVDIAYGIEKVAQKYLPPPTYFPPPAGRLGQTPGQSWGGQQRRPGQAARARYQLRSRTVIGVFVIGLIVAGILDLFRHPPLIPLDIFASILSLLLLVAGIDAISRVIGAIHTRGERKRAQTAREVARKRRYYEDTIAAYQYALSLNSSDGDAFRGMGNAFYALERYSEALNAFLRAIECNSTSATAFAGLGNVYASLKQYHEAVAAYEKAIELDPTVTFNYDRFTQSLLAVGRKREAEQARARAKQLGYK